MTNIPEKIENATVVIAGASSGFGKGAALELAKQGAKVVVAARRTTLLEELVETIKQQGGSALAVTADVSVQDDIDRLAQQTLATYGRIDVWINNVGVGALGYFWDIPLEAGLTQLVPEDAVNTSL